jgi:hypothetical protein
MKVFVGDDYRKVYLQIIFLEYINRKANIKAL